MGKTDHLRKQHKELLGLAGEISSQLNAQQLGSDATHVRQLLSTLSGKLTVHLAMEDKHMYPMLLSSSDTKIRELAERYIKEMGGIADAFKSYKNKWPSQTVIKENPAGFIDDTNSVFKVLAARINREDNELYNFVDKM